MCDWFSNSHYTLSGASHYLFNGRWASDFKGFLDAKKWTRGRLVSLAGVLHEKKSQEVFAFFSVDALGVRQVARPTEE